MNLVIRPVHDVFLEEVVFPAFAVGVVDAASGLGKLQADPRYQPIDGIDAAGSEQDLKVLFARQVFQDPGVVHVVFDNQQDLVAGLDIVAVVVDDFGHR